MMSTDIYEDNLSIDAHFKTSIAVNTRDLPIDCTVVRRYSTIHGRYCDVDVSVTDMKFLPKSISVKTEVVAEGFVRVSVPDWYVLY